MLKVNRIEAILFIIAFAILTSLNFVSALDTSKNNDLTITLNTSTISGQKNNDLTIALTQSTTSGEKNNDLTIALNQSTISGQKNNDLTIALTQSTISGEKNNDLTIALSQNKTSGYNEKNNDLTIAMTFTGSKESPATIVSISTTWLTAASGFTLSCSDIWSSCSATYLKIINYDESCGTLSQGASGNLNCTGLSCKKKLCFYSTDAKGNQETLQETIFTIVVYNTPTGSPTGWSFGSVSSSSTLVRSGSPENWTWRQTEPLSGRDVPHGSVTDWIWVDE